LSEQNTPETSDKSAIITQLESEDEHIQLAVDLIYLLESNNLSPNTVVKALDIVKADFANKLPD
jgi:hypothetical protein